MWPLVIFLFVFGGLLFAMVGFAGFCGLAFVALLLFVFLPYCDDTFTGP